MTLSCNADQQPANQPDEGARKLYKTMTTQTRRRRKLEPMKNNYVLIAGLAVSLLAGCATYPRATNAWEYKILNGKFFGSENRLDAALNNQVADGWELVPPIHFGENDWGYALLRRQKK